MVATGQVQSSNLKRWSIIGRLPVPVEIGPNVRTFRAARLAREHDPEGDRFSLATNAKRVCAEIMLKQSNKIMMRFHLIAS
jgi:hypothetical protein